jgi:hypothetical protein
MITFKQYLREDTLPKLAWDPTPKIGWWRDADPLRLYHGTNLAHLDSFAEHGMNRPDPRTGMYSFAFEPFTARAFAIMGGEARLLASKAKPGVVPENQRVVIVFDIPQDWIERHQDLDLRGNDEEHLSRLQDKSKYDGWKGSDQQYYQLCELRVDAAVPAKFIAGYMLK